MLREAHLVSDAVRGPYKFHTASAHCMPCRHSHAGPGPALTTSRASLRGDRGDSPLHHRPAHPCTIAPFTPAPAAFLRRFFPVQHGHCGQKFSLRERARRSRFAQVSLAALGFWQSARHEKCDTTHRVRLRARACVVRAALVVVAAVVRATVQHGHAVQLPVAMQQRWLPALAAAAPECIAFVARASSSRHALVLALLTCAHMYRVLLCCSPGGGSGGGACDGPTWPHGPAASGQRRCQQQLPGVHCLCRPRPIVAPCASHSPCSRALACVVCAAAVQYGHSTATARPHSTASAAAAPYGQPQYGQPQYGQ